MIAGSETTRSETDGLGPYPSSGMATDERSERSATPGSANEEPIDSCRAFSMHSFVSDESCLWYLWEDSMVGIRICTGVLDNRNKMQVRTRKCAFVGGKCSPGI